MSVLNSADVSKVVRMLPKEVRKTLLKGECVLAGGFIRDAIAGNEINDIDLFPIYTAPTLSEISPRENTRSSATLESCPSNQAWAVSNTSRLVRMYVTGSLPVGCRWVDDSRDARGPNGAILRVPLHRLQPGWEWVAGSPIHPGAGIPNPDRAVRRTATRPSTYRLPARDRNWAVTEHGVPVELFITASIGNCQWCDNSRDARNQHGVVMRIPATDYLPSGWQWVDSTIYPGAGYPVTGPQSWAESFRSPHANNTSTTTAAAPWGSELAERIANEVAFPYDAEPSQHAFNVKGMKYPVQVIRIGRPENAQQVLDSFDFSMCRAAVWFKNSDTDGGWKSLCHDSFYEDLSAKRLVYCSPVDENLGSSLLRLLKFYGKGFTAPNETISQIVARVAKAPNETVEAVAQNVNQSLRNVYGTPRSVSDWECTEESGVVATEVAAEVANGLQNPESYAAAVAQAMGASNQMLAGMPVPDNRPVERRTPPPRTGSFIWGSDIIPAQNWNPYPIAESVASNAAVAEHVTQASTETTPVSEAIEQALGVYERRTGMRDMLTPATQPNRASRQSARLTPEEYESLRSSVLAGVMNYRPDWSVATAPVSLNAAIRTTPSGVIQDITVTEATTSAGPQSCTVDLVNPALERLPDNPNEQQVVAVVPSTGEVQQIQNPPSVRASRDWSGREAWYERMRCAVGNRGLPASVDDFMNLPYHLRGESYENYNRFYSIDRTPGSVPGTTNASNAERAASSDDERPLGGSPF